MAQLVKDSLIFKKPEVLLLFSGKRIIGVSHIYRDLHEYSPPQNPHGLRPTLTSFPLLCPGRTTGSTLHVLRLQLFISHYSIRATRPTEFILLALMDTITT